MKKPMIIMLIGVAALFTLIFGWKAIKGVMIKKYLASLQHPAMSVSTMKVEYSLWQPKLASVASLRAILGINVTTELAGAVSAIYFKPGQKVNKGDLLVQLNAGTELGQLRSLQAQVQLAKITFQRDKAQLNVHAVSKQVVDTDEWNLKNLQAQMEQQNATAQKKTIKAPFSGYLGIFNVNPGQYLNPGDTITVLQALDPIYADFYLPQQALSQLKLGQVVNVTADAYPKEVFKGKITTIVPLVDSATRNVQVEATLPNAQLKLKPGMFAHAEIDVATPKRSLTIPQSAISFNPFGDIVFIVKESGKKDSKNQALGVVKEVFVTVGATRGDQIEILKGLQPGDIIVTSGQLKLKNGSSVVINNSVSLNNEAKPKDLNYGFN